MPKFTEPLIALKPLRYNTRRLIPGDAFMAKPGDSRLLIAVKKAKKQDRVPGTLPPPPASLTRAVKPEDDPDALKAARAEYEAKVGRRPFMGWGLDELRGRMAAAS